MQLSANHADQPVIKLVGDATQQKRRSKFAPFQIRLWKSEQYKIPGSYHVIGSRMSFALYSSGSSAMPRIAEVREKSAYCVCSLRAFRCFKNSTKSSTSNCSSGGSCRSSSAILSSVLMVVLYHDFSIAQTDRTLPMQGWRRKSWCSPAAAAPDWEPQAGPASRALTGE